MAVLVPEIVDIESEGLGLEELHRFRALIGSPVLLSLFDYWMTLDRTGGLPAATDVDAINIPRKVLPHCMLIDVEWREPGTSPRLRFRLVGTVVVDNRAGLAPADPTGRPLDEVEFHEGSERPLQFYGQTATLRRPRYHRLAYAEEHPRSVGFYHRLALPLSTDGRRVNRILAGFSRDK